MEKRKNLPRIALALILAGAIAWAAFNGERVNALILQVQPQGHGPWGPVVFVFIYALATVLLVPGSLLTIAGGGLFGPVWGTIWNLAGAVLGASLAFLAARYLGSQWVASRIGGRLARIIEGVEAEGWRFVAFVRLVPLFPFNLLNYALGLTRLSFATYFVTSAVCMLPGAIAYTYLGYAGRQAAAGSADAVRNAMLALALLAVVAFIPRLVRRFREKVEYTSVRALRELLENGGETAVVDVREPNEFDGPLGHIPGARNIPLPELNAKVSSLSKIRAAQIITVCRTDKRAAKAAQLLKRTGFKLVRVLSGGMEAWNREGLAVERRGSVAG